MTVWFFIDNKELLVFKRIEKNKCLTHLKIKKMKSRFILYLVSKSNNQWLSFQRFGNKKLFVCLLLVIAVFLMQCSSSDKNISDHSETGEVPQINEDIFEESWLEAKTGNMPLVISAPHGGEISPQEISNRACGTNSRDNNTAQLSLEIENVFNQYGKQPYLIVAQIARTKIDLNRDLSEATCGNSLMNTTWNRYHQYIEEALASAIKEFGYALYIDLHGQSHPVRRLELGYLLSKLDLKDNYDQTNPNATLAEKSSIKNLLELNGNLNFRELLIGENALGTLLQNAGFPSVPSLDDPFPQADDPYFNGGYNTRRYTSSDHPKVFGLQIEANFQGVRDSEENRKKFSEAFVQSIMNYLDFLDVQNN
tara:strand:+ start:11196 stop:12293 length:1098 start_codon:yes stop_codon:yes gene_type:complete